MSFADRRRSSGAFIEGRKLSIHSGESFRSHGGELVNGGGGGGGVKWKRETYKTQQLKPLSQMSFGFGLCIILSLVSQLLHRKLRCGCIFYYVHFHFLFHFILISLCVVFVC